MFHGDTRPAHVAEYRIAHCIPHWRAAGFEVVTQFGVARPLAGDLIIPQIDLSVLPDAYRRALDAHPRVLNRAIVDIRKRTFSRNLVRADDAWDGPVIVKTDANYGGRPEHRLALRRPWPRRVRPLLAALRSALRHPAARLARAERLDPDDYPVFASKRDVPAAVFTNPALVVERFRPEREHGRYHIRSYAFLGDRDLTVRTAADHPIVKGFRGTSLEHVPTAPAIVAARTALGFDYGKFDYVINADEAVLLDVNATPSFGRVYSPAARADIARALAAGITTWLTGAR